MTYQNYNTSPDAASTVAPSFSAISDTQSVPETVYFVALDYDFLDKWQPILKGNEFKVLVYLLRRKGANKEAHPKKRTIAKDNGLNLITVERILKSLEKHGLIRAEAYFDFDHEGRQCANRYYFPIETHKVLYPRPLCKDIPPSPSKRKAPTKKIQGKSDSLEHHAEMPSVSSQEENVSPQTIELKDLLLKAGFNNSRQALEWATEWPEIVREQLRKSQTVTFTKGAGQWLNSNISREIKAAQEAPQSQGEAQTPLKPQKRKETPVEREKRLKREALEDKVAKEVLEQLEPRRRQEVFEYMRDQGKTLVEAVDSRANYEFNGALRRKRNLAT